VRVDVFAVGVYDYNLEVYMKVNIKRISKERIAEMRISAYKLLIP